MFHGSNETGGPPRRLWLIMDRSTRMVLIAGVLMLALLVAVIGSVSADSVTWNHAGHLASAPSSQPL